MNYGHIDIICHLFISVISTIIYYVIRVWKVMSLKKSKRQSNVPFLLMVLPGTLWLILFFYIPAMGNVVAFKDFRFEGSNFIENIILSKWVGFKNFEFMFATKTIIQVIRNTLLYNLGFIIFGLVAAVAVSLIANELRSKRAQKVYQTLMLLPYFLSWIIISYFVYSFLSPDKGIFNSVLKFMGHDAISWYTEPLYWPAILISVGIWKNIGYNAAMYFATVVGIDKTYYEAAMMDGATKWQQAMRVTVPLLRPLMIVLTLLAIGNIFKADFGLFYQVTRNSGPLYSVTSVLDTFIYNGLIANGDIGMSSAAGLFQSTVGLVLITGANLIVRKIDPDSALF